MKKLTPWFDGNIKPVNIGPYQNGYDDIYQFWNGKFWGRASVSPEGAAVLQDSKSFFQDDEWRGLAVKPKSGIKTRKPKAK